MRNFDRWRAVMRSMKLFLSLVLTVVATSSQALAGLTYDFTSSSSGMAAQTIAGNVKAEGKNIRIDIATGESGTPFVAPADGVVALAAETEFSLEGYLLMIDHGNGLNSAFLHCSKIAVNEGDVVRQGQYIGNIGASGRATGPHLHWSLKWRDARLDPLLFTGPMN